MRYDAIEIEPLAPPPKRTYKRIPHERMSGTIPVWETTKASTINRLMNNTPASAVATPLESFQNTLTQTNSKSGAEESYSFGDIIDIINPLHHIPLVGTLYRTVTNDTIKDSSKIVGGAIYGGALGGAMNLAGTIIKEEFSQPSTKTALNNPHNNQTTNTQETPEIALNNAYNNTLDDYDTTRTLLSFADLSTPQETLATLKKPNYYIKQTSEYND